MDTPRLAAEYLVLALQRKLGLTDQQTYASISPHYVEGQPPIVVQVVPGNTTTEGGGRGSQDGGALLRRQSYKLVVWMQSNVDPHGWTQQALIEASLGMLDFMETVRNLFKFTTLGGIFYEPMKYEGETDTFAFDEDRGIFYRTLTLSAPYGETLPSSVTVTASDLS